MKKLATWLINKFKLDRRNHPTRNSIMLIVIETIGAIVAGLALAFGDAEEYPVPAIINFIILLYWGGFISHEIDCIIGRKRNAWWHLDITNPQIIRLIHALANAQKDINDGKVAWIGNFYDPSKERIEATRVPIEEYLADDPKPTVDGKAPE